jgi:hypothetical protein
MAVEKSPYNIFHINKPNENLLKLAMRFPEIKKIMEDERKIIQHDENQTNESCLAMVKQDGLMLEHVKNKTPEICLAAILQNEKAKEFVPKNF